MEFVLLARPVFIMRTTSIKVSDIRVYLRSRFNTNLTGHWERMPYDNSAIRSIYHIREYNIRRLSLVRTLCPSFSSSLSPIFKLSSPSIFLSHDWPRSIEQHGDLRGLLNRKPFFRQDIETGNLGSPPLMGLLRTLKPDWWFSAHLHVRFQAAVAHDGGRAPGSNQQAASPVPLAVPNPDEIAIDDDDDIENGESAQTEALPADDDLATQSSAPPRNSDEIILSDEEEEVAVPPPPPPPPSETKFLALDKCLPKRQFLEVSIQSSPLRTVRSSLLNVDCRRPSPKVISYFSAKLGPGSSSAEADIRPRMVGYHSCLSSIFFDATTTAQISR